MISIRRLSNLIQTLYAAAEDEARWPAFLEIFAEAVDARMTVLVSSPGADGAGGVSTFVRADPEAVRAYNQTWAAEDVWLGSGHESIRRVGAVTYGEEMISDRDLVQTSFYNEFMRRFDMFHTMVATLGAEEHSSAGLACHYPQRSRSPGKAQIELFEILTPHGARRESRVPGARPIDDGLRLLGR